MHIMCSTVLYMQDVLYSVCFPQQVCRFLMHLIQAIFDHMLLGRAAYNSTLINEMGYRMIDW